VEQGELLGAQAKLERDLDDGGVLGRVPVGLDRGEHGCKLVVRQDLGLAVFGHVGARKRTGEGCECSRRCCSARGGTRGGVVLTGSPKIRTNHISTGFASGVPVLASSLVSWAAERQRYRNATM